MSLYFGNLDNNSYLNQIMHAVSLLLNISYRWSCEKRDQTPVAESTVLSRNKSLVCKGQRGCSVYVCVLDNV